jgi:aspartyl aminopeptidase
MHPEHKFAEELIEFIHQGASPFHVTENISLMLDQAGFQSLELTQPWNLQKGGKYYVSRNGSALFAFVIGTGEPEETGFRIVASHSDSPTFKIKPDPEMGVDNYFIKLNTEVYGGPILMSWLDRPLSIAGRVSLKGEHALWPDNRLVNFNHPLLIIPSLAIHLNRSVNEGMAFNLQKDMLPLLGILPDGKPKKGFLNDMIAKELGVNSDDIIDFDLTLNEFNKGCVMGVHHEFISSPKLDNLAMTHAGLVGLLNSSTGESSQLLAVFDNEEVGSLTKQGAGSPVFRHLFERILTLLGKNTEQIQRTIYNSFMISADMAHSVHPNYEEKYDPVLHPLMNNGPVIKITANQKYTSDGDSIAVFESICQKANVPCQKFVNRSDSVGGSTLGNVSTGQLDIRTVDVGSAMLSMHSVRELSGVKDHEYIIRAFQTFFNE